MSAGFAGMIARAFLQSQLTPILVVVSLLLGFFVVGITPREEEPQIIVPMIDVQVSYPGANPQEIEERVTKPMEQLLWEIPGVEYIYSIIQPGQNMTIVRFRVGENTENSLVNLYTKLMANYDRIPPGVSQPLVKARSIDDVPILALTLWSEQPSYTGYELRRIAVEVAEELKKGEHISEIQVIGGQRRQVRVTLDPERLQAYQLTGTAVGQAIDRSNVRLQAGVFPAGNRQYTVETGLFLQDPADVAGVVVGLYQNKPVYLKDVATVQDVPEEPGNYVSLGLGPAAAAKGLNGGTGQYPAVTVSLAKQKGANATAIAADALNKVAALRGKLIPAEVQVTVTRDYGETAREKSDELLQHMLIATFSVVLLIGFFLGWRAAVVVAVAVPVTLALTLVINYLYGYTLNRVTLFALIFSIGILVDDAIVVVENIHRHFNLHGVSPQTAIQAVDEVGNPTILATFAVIAALLPMAFVSGLMGPYMRPIPVGASAAMLFSLLVAFIISPWLSYIVLKQSVHAGADPAEERIRGFYGRILSPLLDDRRRRLRALAAVAALLAVVLVMLPTRLVEVKMLPFDNKSELQVIVDMPEGTALEQTAMVSRELGEYLKTVPEVTDYQTYVGAASPYNFNGLVRHYFMRNGSNMADLQVNFLDKGQRSLQSHELAKRLRPELKKIGDRYGARLKIAEIPPGPPVQSTIVAEIYGPDTASQIAIAAKIKDIFLKTDGVVDVDWLVESPQPKLTLTVDPVKAAYHGISVAAAAQTLQLGLQGQNAGLLHLPREKEAVPIWLRMPVADRSQLLQSPRLAVASTDGRLIPLAELVTARQGEEDKTIYHKNLRKVTYVTADVAVTKESPVYAILEMKDKVAGIQLPQGYELRQYNAVQPWMEDKYAMKWDGEWHITIEVFRDLGIAFAAVLLLIYILVVAWFRSFVTPIVIMAPIPLTLVGILPGHWLFGAFFTATSMIGFIALAGIIVRNSVLLIDFVEMEYREKGDLKVALLEACTIRFRPIVLTAAAVVVGSFVMLFDPIFQGLAIAMMFGAVAATGLTLLAVPLLYYEFFGGRDEVAQLPPAEKQKAERGSEDVPGEDR